MKQSFLKKNILFIFIFIIFFTPFSFSKTADKWITQGIKEKKLAHKILSFNKAIEASKENPELLASSYYNRGVAYYEMKEFEKAAKDFEDSLKIAPDNIDTLKNAGLSYLIVRRYNDAIEHFEKIIKLQPDASIGYFLRANAYLEKKIYSAAIRDYNLILLRDPYHIDARNNRGWAYLYFEKFSKSLLDFDKVLSIKPNDLSALEGRKKILKILDKH